MRRAIRRLIVRMFVIGAALAAATVVVLLVLHVVFPFPAGWLDAAERGGSPLILDRDGRPVAWRVDPQENWRLPVVIEDVSPWLVAATVAAEDKRFYAHPGVDPAAVLRAAAQNLVGGRRVSGASTITMQVVRLLRPRPRTYAAKAIEAFRALQLERLVGKQRVLELYFDLAPYGGNVVGAEAAARVYFGKRAADLTLGETAFLAGLPQRPARFNPRRHLSAALERREYVFTRMRELGLVDAEGIAAARREPIALAERTSPPDAAPFADWTIARLGRDCGAVRTTLDAAVQAAVATAVERHAAEFAVLGIDGVAAVVIDVERAALLAMVGSADPTDPLSGQVNAAARPRQPGSLLKPFLYARAYGAGLLTPDAVVLDVPTAWPGYSPENIDRRFLGPIPARRALAESRNLPAVRLLGRLSVDRLATDMAALGMRVDAAAENCGLSLALGTAELRLVDLANAYAALARLGQWHPLRAVADDPDSSGRRVYSPGAAYLALRSLPTDAGGGGPLRTAWKTGTSWNQRDAWAVALTPSHVAAVWCGKLSGQGHPVLLGARAALPLALEIAGLLPDGGAWSRPDSVRLRPICAVSGAPAGPDCPCVVGEYLPGVSSDVPCRVHRCMGRGDDRRVVEIWPPEVAAWRAAAGASVHGASAAAAGPPSPAAAQRGLTIVVPSPRAEYVIDPAAAAGNVLHLRARAVPGTRWVYWFVDGELLRRAARGRSVAAARRTPPGPRLRRHALRRTGHLHRGHGPRLVTEPRPQRSRRSAREAGAGGSTHDLA